MSERGHLSATVHGIVQGVYFRSFVRSEARALGLTGYVRNLPGGHAVRVEAEGDKTGLASLLDHLETGPLGARVVRVDVDWSDHSGRFTDFSIRF